MRLKNLFFLLNRFCSIFLVSASIRLSWRFSIYCYVICQSILLLLCLSKHFHYLVTFPLAWAPGWWPLQQVNVWLSVRGYKLQLTAISQICGLCDQRLRALLSTFTRQQLSLCETGLRLSCYFCQHCHLWLTKFWWGCFFVLFFLFYPSQYSQLTCICKFLPHFAAEEMKTDDVCFSEWKVIDKSLRHPCSLNVLWKKLGGKKWAKKSVREECVG